MTSSRSLTFTPHAQERMAEFNVSYDEVVQIINHPEVAYMSKRSVYDRYTLVSQAGKWAVITTTNKTVVITILPRITDEWEH